ncbi:HalOD1 output domain-containing protein [Halorussus caseinilyticus]|uniref:HalOD1 output domain-containing protein n=1 Tax=Halorussus caseinilyticus TaxID=3034025 RepID=A0ABD5WIM0_9EURY|nr:HalOD1 output domain-containing protein [Halorussus sp. DT72]
MSRDTDLTERAPSLDRDGRAAYRIASTDWSVSTAVVRAVTEISGCDLLPEEGVLYDVVDPDALDRLFADRGGVGETVGRVVFDLQGCRVEVRADGEHVVYEPTERDESPASAAQSA